jgi:hypothetical protein
MPQEHIYPAHSLVHPPAKKRRLQRDFDKDAIDMVEGMKECCSNECLRKFFKGDSKASTVAMQTAKQFAELDFESRKMVMKGVILSLMTPNKTNRGKERTTLGTTFR